MFIVSIKMHKCWNDRYNPRTYAQLLCDKYCLPSWSLGNKCNSKDAYFFMLAYIKRGWIVSGIFCLLETWIYREAGKYLGSQGRENSPKNIPKDSEAGRLSISQGFHCILTILLSAAFTESSVSLIFRIHISTQFIFEYKVENN